MSARSSESGPLSACVDDGGGNHGTWASDVDILVDFETESFSAYFGLLNYSEDLLGVHVDLVVPSALRPQIRGSVMAEAVSVA